MLSEIILVDCQRVYFTANLIFPPYLIHHSLLHGKLFYLGQIFRECSWFRVTFAISSVPLENLLVVLAFGKSCFWDSTCLTGYSTCDQDDAVEVATL